MTVPIGYRGLKNRLIDAPADEWSTSGRQVQDETKERIG